MQRKHVGVVLCLSALSLGAVRSDSSQSQAVQLKNLLRAETQAILAVTNCANLSNAAPLIEAARVVATRHAELASSRQAIEDARRSLANDLLRHGCSSPTAVQSRIILLAVHAPGGGIDNMPVPELVLATLYMSDAERAEFEKALSPETRADLQTFLSRNQLTVSRIRSEIAPGP
jgi:hypothetical protein